ncbi:MAG: DUF4422 domain-containing protein [Prevotellaceae bacterium]|nr:DUF4422 domain-containing protein [Prevotellaceae bacterium]
MNIKILIATHKKYHMPQDDIYLPVMVGSTLCDDDFGYQRDDEGENISSRNPFFCELTAMYWAWKNLHVDYVGLVHYRRHFCLKKKRKSKFACILKTEEVNNLCNKYNVILPKKRRYYIESLASHYKHTHDIEHLELTREIIKVQYPEYQKEFDKVMQRSYAHMFNMCIMKKDIFDQYCTWLFTILFHLEKEVNTDNLSPYDARLFGRVSELLLDVWIEHNHIQYKEIGFVQLGNENWIEKIKDFLNAKFYGKKYDHSK